MKIQHYFFLVLRYLWLILLIVGASLAGAWAWLGKQQPVYASRSVLQVEWANNSVMDKIKDVQDNRLTGIDALNTEVQMLTNNTIMLAVANSIGRAEEWAKNAPSGKVTPDMENTLAASVRNQLSVGLRRGTRLIDITAEDSTPAKAALLASKVPQVFLEMKEESRSGVYRGANDSLVQQAVKLRAKLKDSEEKLAEYRLQHNSVSLDEKQNTIGQRLASLNSQVTEANTKRASLETDLAVLDKVQPDDLEGLLKVPSVVALPAVAQKKAQLSARESEFGSLKQRYLELHPKYITAKNEIDEIRKGLNAEVSTASQALRQQYANFKENEAKLKTMLEEQEKASFELEKISVPYKVLQQEASTDRDLYKEIESRLKQVNVTQGMAENNFSLVENAMENGTPVRPNKNKTMILAGLLALAFCLGIIFLIDYLDSSVRTVDEAESLFSLPVLAAVPEGKVADIEKGDFALTHDPDSAQAESFRSLRASLALLGEESKRRLILVTSGIPSEGKTFTSMNLAASFALQGFKTLVIDADLRRPALSTNLMENADRKLDSYRGLTDVLSGICTVQEATRKTSLPDLFLLPSGRRAPNPAEILAQAHVPQFLQDMLKEYDRVVVDSAPVNAVSDSLSLAPYCHAVCMVLRFGKTPRRAINRAIQLLKNSGARMAGLIMNRMPTSRGASYYYYYYGESYTDAAEGKRGKKSKKSRQQEA